RSSDTPAETYAWTNEYKPGARQFFFTAGHPEEFEEPHNATMLYNAVLWCLGREVPTGGALAEQVDPATRAARPSIAVARPPTMTAPADATVLFDGRDLSQWDWWFGGKEPRVFELDDRAHSGAGLPDFSGARWKLDQGAAVATPGVGDIVTREHFSDYQLHLDFLTPPSPDDVDRLWRGNSGVYLNGAYEIQILDRREGDPADRFSCGALTGQTAPSKSAAKPAGQWQSLDVAFRAARFERGRKVLPARVTVVLNGETIHDNVALSQRSTWGMREHAQFGPHSGPIRLESDTAPVRFANIWVRPLASDEVERRLPHRRELTGQPWVDMDYGPYFSTSLEVAPGNIAKKGVAIRLDPGPGGVASGRRFMLFDTDTLRYAAGWSGSEFINWRGIALDGAHETHPRIVGERVFANPDAPGWALPGAGEFVDDRLIGLDGNRYGPVDKAWARWNGLYLHGRQTILSYEIGDAEILESPSIVETSEGPVFARTFNMGPRSEDLVLQVAHGKAGSAEIQTLDGTGAAADAQIVSVYQG
ncbi:MAG: DUF1080 domain-containing protein, partial [Planctomycetota bacterium]